MPSLWGEEFEIPNERSNAEKLMKKLEGKTEAQLLKSKLTPIERKINIIEENVRNLLGHYENIITVIKTPEDLTSYIDKVVENGIIALDTETNNSLDPITCKLMGLCIYTPGLKSAYIPVNHIDRRTGERLKCQVNETNIHDELQRLLDAGVKIIMHNGQFDYQVVKCTCDIDLTLYWDTYGGAKMIDENELSAGLKQQYIDKIDPEQEKYSIEGLFTGLPYAIFDPDIFAYYSAVDPYMTYKLYGWQKERFKDPALSGNYKLFTEVEIPLELVLARMTLRGISLDKPYAERLSQKYHKLLQDATDRVNTELKKYDEIIRQWRLSPEANVKKDKKDGTKSKSKSEQLNDPIQTGSPTQLAIFLYDILKVPQVNKKSPRGTGVTELTDLADVRPDLTICKLILEQREIKKMLDTFIDKMQEVANETDGRVHPSFNNYGTATGRMASSDPNLQNIPSHNNEIRTIFRAQRDGKVSIPFDGKLRLENYDKVSLIDGTWIRAKELKSGDIIKGVEGYYIIDNIKYRPNYIDYEIYLVNTDGSKAKGSVEKERAEKILIGSDYSQLEVKTTVHTCRDAAGIQAYKDGKDLYAVVASLSFGKKYEECLEFYPEGTVVSTVNGDVVAGNEKTSIYTIEDNSVTIPYYKHISTQDGFKDVGSLVVGDTIKVNSDGQSYSRRIKNTSKVDDSNIRITLNEGLGKEVIVKSPDKITNVEGKALRSYSKSILLGSIYQRGAASIAEQINATIKEPSKKKTVAEVQKMMDDFYSGFPAMSKWMEDSKKFARQYGYVTSSVGRRRLLPDATLPPYEVLVPPTPYNTKFNPFLNCEDRVDTSLRDKYLSKLRDAKSIKDVDQIKQEASLEGVTVKDNRGFIAKAERQAVNSQCQSLGADIVKKLMITLDEDEVLKNLGFTLLLQIHDEIIGECPIETQDRVIDRVNEIMSKVPEDMGILVPFTTDAYAVSNWYIDEIENGLSKTYNEMTSKGIAPEDIVEKISSTHTELTKNSISNYLLEGKPLTTD